MSSQGKDWDGAPNVESFREGRISHMQETVDTIREILTRPDLPAALQAWSQRMCKAIAGAKT